LLTSCNRMDRYGMTETLALVVKPYLPVGIEFSNRLLEAHSNLPLSG
jgi:hypothetical protein